MQLASVSKLLTCSGAGDPNAGDAGRTRQTAPHPQGGIRVHVGLLIKEDRGEDVCGAADAERPRHGTAFGRVNNT